jgi:hypothetical protein
MAALTELRNHGVADVKVRDGQVANRPVRRHLERISCGIPAESGQIEPPQEARKPSDPRVNPRVSANDGDQTS